jgi:inner membrane protein
MINSPHPSPDPVPRPGLLAGLAASTLVKLGLLGFLVLVLLIPVSQVTDLVRERQGRQMSVADEIAGTWGGPQRLVGPVLAVPYHVSRINRQVVDGRVVDSPYDDPGTVYLLPKTLSWRGTMAPELRSRGIFDVVVYASELTAEGSFVLPTELVPGEPLAKPHWAEARLALAVPDPKGLVRGISLRLQPTAGSELAVAFTPGTGPAQGVLGSGISAAIVAPAQEPPEPGSTLAFAFDLALRGSQDLQVLAAGEETTLTLTSPWPSPSFSGAFLPSDRTVGPAGFQAKWSVPYFGRGFPQQWDGASVDLATLQAAEFGVTLVQPADGYQRTERAVKYAALFILLTFGLLFMLELLSPVRLHPAQYLLVGFSLCLFFLLLLAISEHLGFEGAYGLAAVATTLLVAGYTAAILAAPKHGLAVAAALGTLYGYLFVLLRLEDLALLLGALGLFAVLAGVMFLTRRLDWYSLRFRAT